MTLWRHAYAGYASYDGGQWGDPEYSALKFVQALKGKPINGYGWIPRLNGMKLKVSEETRLNAFTIFGEWAAAKLVEIGLAPGQLVAVPASNCLCLGDDEKGRSLCAAIEQRASGWAALAALHWAKQWPKAAEGGTRDPDVLITNLRIINNLPAMTMVLVDDVGTSGGHLIACARGLRHFGHTVEHALCAAQTVHARPAGGMFRSRRSIWRPIPSTISLRARAEASTLLRRSPSQPTSHRRFTFAGEQMGGGQSSK